MVKTEEEDRRQPGLQDSSDGRLLADLLASAPVGVILVDQQGTIVLCNREAEELFGYRQEELLGQEVELLLPARFRERHRHYRQLFLQQPERRSMGGDRSLVARHRDGHEFPIEVGLGHTKRQGRVYVSAVIADISRRVAVEQEKENLIGELQQALNRVRQLSGLLPICATCKKIRDDRGYWNRIETYIKAHSNVDFSHSICPDCARKLYQDYFPESSE